MDDKRIDYELAQAEDFERRSQALHQSTGRRASNDFDVLAHLCRRKAAILQELGQNEPGLEQFQGPRAGDTQQEPRQCQIESPSRN